jgi:hypothetical protein
MLPNLLQRACAKPMRFLLSATLAAGLVACGGGGGNARAPDPTQPTVGSISLSSSSATIDASGTPGTEVTLTAIVKNSTNNAMSGVTVSFAADSGTITSTSRTTGVDGSVVEKLSVAGDASLRPIKITASVGGVRSNEIIVTVVPAPATAPKLLLTASAGVLPSAGTTDVEIRALVLSTANVVMPNAVVTFQTDSGALSAAQAVTNAAGLAIVKLGTGTNPANRVVTVKASVANAPDALITVAVTGTKLTLNVVPTLNVGAVSEVTAELVDSSGIALGNYPVVFSAVAARGNTLKVKDSGAASPATTNNLGKITLNFTAVNPGEDTVSVSALGAADSKKINIVSSVFTVKPVDATGNALVPARANTNACTAIAVSNFSNNVAVGGTVVFSSSRGTMYSDINCTVALGSTPVAMNAGQAKAYVKAGSPGVTTISATSSETASTAQGVLEIVAPLTATSIITMQATPSVVGVNTATSNEQQSVLRVVVTDKASQGNPVQGAKVALSILSDPSGGALAQPSEVTTGADGSATVSYIAGTTATAVGGVSIQAVIQSPITTASTTTKLTVAQQALTITAGTGNTILTPNSATYAIDYVVVVADAAGNAVRDVTLTASIRPRNYYKGHFFATGGVPAWARLAKASCINEDRDSDGVLGALEDDNNNGRLEPGIPVTITAKGKTDATGTAIVQILYPRDRAFWLDVDFTITGTVSGSEGRYVGYTLLPGLATDYNTADKTPPGVISPYGDGAVCSDPN